MSSSPQTTVLPLKGLSDRQLQYPRSTQPSTHLERKKNVNATNKILGIGWEPLWEHLAMPDLLLLRKKSKRARKGKGEVGGRVKPNLMKKMNFWCLCTERKKIRLCFCLLYMGFLDIKKLGNARSYQRVVFFLVLHGKECPACSKLTNTIIHPALEMALGAPTCGLTSQKNEIWVSKTWHLCLKVRTYFTTHFNLIYYMSYLTCSRIWKYYSMGMVQDIAVIFSAV